MRLRWRLRIISGLEIDRYGPLLAQSALERALAGGPMRGVPSASAQVSSVNAGVGVNGSAQSAGLGGGGGGGSGGSSGNAAIQQVGAITPNLDPILQSTTTQAHLTQPQANTVLSQTNALIQSVRTIEYDAADGADHAAAWCSSATTSSPLKKILRAICSESGGGSAHGSGGPPQPVAGFRRQVERPRHPDREDQYRSVAWNRSARNCWTWWRTY